ncbi:Snf7-domain-containing protein [Irpex rosettiformis]|uniref:Snf7-domain-containing protein n=1 Tax=Irpex rosettiformis TaxID=378272 RepID=A0ACB8UHF7_9APHY|nr:Snf7-domain-containing protein [Irpex rosettiformis]
MTSAGSSHSQLYDLPTFKNISSSRLKFLYSDFSRQKQSNPASFTSNAEWWRRTLEAITVKGWQEHGATHSAHPNRLVLHATGPQIIEQFKVEGVGKPLGLATVISELCEQKAFFPLNQFRTSKQSIYDPGWLPYRIASFIIGKPLWWALQQLSIVSSDEGAGSESDAQRWKKVKGDYVVINLVEQAAAAVLHQQEFKTGLSIHESLYSFDGFKREFETCAFGGLELSNLDIKVLVKFLERDKRAIMVERGVIKFIDPSEPHEVTPVDIGILELKTAVENLEAAIDRLHDQIDDRTAKISAALKLKRKEVALSHLRAKKQFEELQRKRLNSLDTLQSTLIHVETAAGDIEIMKSYESSSATLRAILAHPSLQREKIDETLEAMASANADARDIDDVIRQGTEIAQADAGIDDSELEDELAALIKEVEQERSNAEAKRAGEIEAKLSVPGLSTPASVPNGEKALAKDREKEAA